MQYETDAWPFLEARDYLKTVRQRTRLIVIHTAETPEVTKAAENVARYFQHPDKPSSAHVCVDNQTVVQSVKDSFIAYAAPGANNDGVHIELCGYLGQSKSDWIDKYSLGVLAIGADVAAQYCLKYSIPAVHLTNDELRDGRLGLVGHRQVSDVYKKSDHPDPGPNFPWQYFIMQVQELVKLRTKP